MQVGGYARAHALKFDQSPHAIAIDCRNSQPECQQNQCNEPPTLPERGKNREVDNRRPGTDAPVCRQSPHHELVLAWRKTSVIDCALIGGGAPILISTGKPVLIAQSLAGREA